MRFISSIVRRLRSNRFSRRLSRSKPCEEDSNDLINQTSETVSFAQGDTDSIDSASSTIVRHSIDEPAQSTETKTDENKLQSMGSISIQTLFDERLSSNFGSDKVVQALSMPEYPVIRLDATPEPPDHPTKSLQEPMEPLQEEGSGRKARAASELSLEQKRQKASTLRKGPKSHQRRSMASAIKTALHSSSSPSKLGSYTIAEGESWVDDENPDKRQREERQVGRRWSGFGVWEAEAVGRLWW
ncbi:hypothetical protein N7510_004930 [Penicillium lagena]|uniref:uncharacterized protein n=1 Tax=Penicillium lagena TaxID=94218 RepID=UPI0025424151|nr:uncharacterized protein N7510_004930 [Penicillium lagena]KAJ5620946.1 hypothetical protein N7510_004930 [Penicillium lagena]